MAEGHNNDIDIGGSFERCVVTGRVNGSLNNTFYSGRPRTPPPKPSSNVVFGSQDDFVARNDVLTWLESRCSRRRDRAALVGMGGVGKSRLAIEYARQVRREKPETWVFWVHASNAAGVEDGYREIAHLAKLVERDDTTKNIVQVVRRWLSSRESGPWLMIVDNADVEIELDGLKADGGKSSLAGLLSQSESDDSTILVTSRDAGVVRGLIKEQNILFLDVMTVDEAIALLNKRLREPVDEKVARQLAQALDKVPLAVIQAAAYINQRPGVTAEDYIGELQTALGKSRLLQVAATDTGRDERAAESILATWQISFAHIRKVSSSAADMLSFLSFFNRQGIPGFIVKRYLDKREDRGIIIRKSQHIYEDDLGVLAAFSLVSVSAKDNMLAMHGLVQFATQVWLRSQGKAEGWCGRYVEAMAQDFPMGTYENWGQCQALFAHVSVDLAQEHQLRTQYVRVRWVKVLGRAAWYAKEQGLYEQAQVLAERSVELAKLVGLTGLANQEEHKVRNKASQRVRKRDVLTQLLGNKIEENSNRRQTDLDRREGDRKKALEATSTSILGSILERQGKYTEAEAMHRQVLATRKKVLGQEHPNTLASISDLAGVLSQQGKHTEAETMHWHALAWRWRVLGRGHTDTLESINNLALALSEQGEYAEAEAMYRQALAGREKVLRREHPHTLASINNLALVLSQQGKQVEAEAMHLRALVGCEKVLGREHPDTLASMNNLALVLSEQGKLAEAEAMHLRALVGRERVLGQEHPDTLASLSDLAYLMAEQQQYDKAAELCGRASIGYGKVLGREHPTTRACREHQLQVLDVLMRRQDEG